MSAREKLFAALLWVASALVVVGVAGWSVPAALIVAGMLVAGQAWLLLAEVGPAEKSPAEVDGG